MHIYWGIKESDCLRSLSELSDVPTGCLMIAYVLKINIIEEITDFPLFYVFLKYAKNTGYHNSLLHPTSVFSQLDIFSLKLLKNFFEGMHVNCNLSSQPSQNYLSFHTNKKHTADNTSTSLSKVISY